ncbi:MAG: SRPBCC domain-containing protein [Chloroflexales bacterium]|nr:SRPBCC domain-containing protein [Chloroflexales bacterium]
MERSIWIAVPRERVWHAITEAKQITQWSGGDDHWEITARQVGATIKFGDPQDLMLATIAVLDPPREFAIEWPPQPQYHGIAMRTRYLLGEEHGGIRVTVIETGFEALPAAIRQQRVDQTAKGYATVLQDLKAYLERSAA